MPKEAAELHCTKGAPRKKKTRALPLPYQSYLMRTASDCFPRSWARLFGWETKHSSYLVLLPIYLSCLCVLVLSSIGVVSSVYEKGKERFLMLKFFESHLLSLVDEYLLQKVWVCGGQGSVVPAHH